MTKEEILEKIKEKSEKLIVLPEIQLHEIYGVLIGYLMAIEQPEQSTA
ncbi:hypothetical protein AGMMS49975_24370 [Clostridia bacterium]|nr:hypothetical protein AGMMS49975_24370 [Clostridia bacterium]